MLTAKDLPWEEYVEVMNQFSFKMWRSEYPSSWLEGAVRSAITKYEKMVKEDLHGIRPLFRLNSYMEEEKRLAKVQKKKSWHTAGREEKMVTGAPLIIGPSAGDHISNGMKKVCTRFKEEHNIDIKVCERGGTKVGSIVKSDSLKPSVCDRGDCFPCAKEGGGDCSPVLCCLQDGMLGMPKEQIKCCISRRNRKKRLQ